MKYNTEYSEVLSIGPTKIQLRLIQPDDKQALLNGLSRLSAQSSYNRFLSARFNLSSTELAYLTELDHDSHLAIVAIARSGPDADEGIAVARYIRDPAEPSIAESAVTVLDGYHHQGLGTILIERLADAALERGIEYFRVMYLGTNQAVRSWLEQFNERIVVQDFEDGMVHALIPLDTQSQHTQKTTERRTNLQELLRQGARGAFTLKQRIQGRNG